MEKMWSVYVIGRDLISVLTPLFPREENVFIFVYTLFLFLFISFTLHNTISFDLWTLRKITEDGWRNWNTFFDWDFVIVVVVGSFFFD
jgi:hypothetical protein